MMNLNNMKMTFEYWRSNIAMAFDCTEEYLQSIGCSEEVIAVIQREAFAEYCTKHSYSII